MFRYLTAGESHGKALVAIVDGVPSGLSLDAQFIEQELKRRQMGFGRGKRMSIESDKAEFLSGIRYGKSIGSPLAMVISNKDWENWKTVMASEETGKEEELLTKPRPGHADLAGILKYGQKDIRNILERASARETAAKTAVGAVAKKILAEMGISILSHVTRIGTIELETDEKITPNDKERIEKSPVRCGNDDISKAMVKAIEEAKEAKDSLGGIFELLVWGVPPGLGSHAAWDRRLDGKIAQSVMSIPAIKGVEIGAGFGLSERTGSQAHDEIFHDEKRGFFRKTNRAGGIEGGMTNGETIVVKASMKPIPTIAKPLKTVDIRNKKASEAFKERADICAVPSAAVIGEATLAITLVEAALEKFGGDSAEDLKSNYQHYMKRLKSI